MGTQPSKPALSPHTNQSSQAENKISTCLSRHPSRSLADRGSMCHSDEWHIDPLVARERCVSGDISILITHFEAKMLATENMILLKFTYVNKNIVLVI